MEQEDILFRRLEEEQKARQALTEKLGMKQLVGTSSAFVAETSKIPMIARSDVSVLISG